MSYVHGHSAAVLKAHARRTAQRDMAHLLPHLQPHFRILDVGCGPGTISADLASLVPQGKVTCLETSEEALSAARATFAERGFTNVEFVVGDATARLPFDEGSFDVVASHQVLIHLPKAAEAMGEMRRVLKTGGVLAAKDMILSSSTWFPRDERLQVFTRGTAVLIERSGADPDMGSGLMALAVGAGFDETRAVLSAGPWAFSKREEREYWGGTCAARLVKGEKLRERLVEGKVYAEEEVDAFVKAAGRWIEMPGAWFGVLHGELICWK